ncbi:MAG: DUF2169 domain-containing protein [Myxococcota bacterium]
MLQLNDTSPFAAQIFGLPDADGVDSLVIVVKGTFQIRGGQVDLAEEPRPIVLADEYVGEAGASSLRASTEAHLPKPGTDVIVVGDACAPEQRPVPQLDVAVSVAGRGKAARVHGDRHWTEGVRGLRPSRAEPFMRMPVVFERAFGGLERGPTGEVVAGEQRNPVGVGFYRRRSDRAALGQPVPNIEDIQDPVETPGPTGTVAGFGPVAPSWLPRLQYAGTYDDAWQKKRAPYLPRDFDPRFFHMAPEGLAFPQPLQGGEPVVVRGFHPRGVLQFALPQQRPAVVVEWARSEQAVPVSLDTVVLEPNDECFTMTWRGILTVDKKLLDVRTVRIEQAPPGA